MKITVKKGKTKIIVDELNNRTKDSDTCLRWNDQMENVHKTIIVMVEQCSLLKKTK